MGFQRGDPLFEVLGQHERILPRFNATQPCPGRTPALGARRISRAERGSALLGSYLDKSGRAEVTIEGIRILDAFLSHHREARGIDERVLSLVVAYKPFPCLLFQVGCYVLDANDGAQADCSGGNRRAVTAAPVEQRPGLAQDMVGGHHHGRFAGPQPLRGAVPSVAGVAKCSPEGRVDEDHSCFP
ncbi:Putative uncharacterized protein [Mycobacterium tuberculosis variant bovis]|uniref:Uncharacterized protein n=1 Tax=Mycobacterium tuberculosis (strain CDC 1551 / Oshkosh) TaxID=83331 RepID=Q8VJF9_MYCTO|nr:hypothetical protein MT2626 [Mycobacterium tuberculosis CDC1551]CEJ29846.1 Putative uncharacterized protein [Mycobacterium tuberculosis variant bovis]CEJ35123.1 Putative uncharacterized protein [Mycobacterium tuberculosis variant bovis]CEJ40311.1 Putative uncharacterized protein [Mycobacterium tuberculosis variant bovis]CEJ53075.1 Putative uncharacterized protein [Mycobacterium tuberculosis variant caprae]